jgi:hypothetical protein
VVKLPARPPSPVAISDDDLTLLPRQTVLWRIHPTSGPHVTAWNTLRFYGPTAGRFDPHPPPPRTHTGYAVGYAALEAYTTFAEVYQRTRTINVTARSPYLTAWQSARPLRLLDVTGTWPAANGASHAINTARHDYCRAWARAIHDHPAAVDGLLHSSAMTGSRAVTLFTPARDSFPYLAELSRALADPALGGIVETAARRINYAVA